MYFIGENEWPFLLLMLLLICLGVDLLVVLVCGLGEWVKRT